MRHWKSSLSLRACSILLVALTLLFISGCGSKTTYPIVPVQGTIKYEDGSIIPAYRIQLKFISQEPPLDKKTHPRPGLGEVKVEDGSFAVSTYGFEDGLIRGTHTVTARSFNEQNLPSPEIPIAYGSPDSSPLEVNAEESPFELVIKRQ